VIGVDADADAVAICTLRGGCYVRAEGEALPFRRSATAPSRSCIASRSSSTSVPSSARWRRWCP